MAQRDSSFGEKVIQDHIEKRLEEKEKAAVEALEMGYRHLAEGQYRAAIFRGVRALALLGQRDGCKYLTNYLGDLDHEYGLEQWVDTYAPVRELENIVADTDFGQEKTVAGKTISTAKAEHVLTALTSWNESDTVNVLAVIGQALAESSCRSEKFAAEAVIETVEVGAAGQGLLDQGEETYTVGEDFEESPLHEMYEKRESQGRSLQAIIVARDNDTGTGKTTLAVSLCKKWGEDWGAENATNRPGEYRDFLNNKPEGSVLLADEIGQMYDSRRSMSSENVEVSQDWQMIRTKEYKTISTLPGPSFLDKRLKKLADVMIVCTRRGHARVYRLKVDDQDGDIWREHLCNVEWGALDDDEDYQAVEQMKRERLAERFEGSDEQDDQDGADADQARREGRNETIRRLVENGMTQTEIAAALDMDQSTVSRIVREDS